MVSCLSLLFQRGIAWQNMERTFHVLPELPSTAASSAPICKAKKCCKEKRLNTCNKIWIACRVQLRNSDKVFLDNYERLNL